MIKLMTAGVGAAAGAVGTGATVPVAPGTGDLFLHTPAGRIILMEYNGSNWNSIISYGAMTVYVDKTDGTDDVDKGTGVDGDAFATVQYAVDQIPGMVSGNVVINVNGESYVEDVIIRGKGVTGAYTITIQGVATELDSLTASSGVQGVGATQGTVVVGAGTWEVQQRKNRWIRFTSGNNDGTRLVIDSNTGSIATMVGAWDDTIANGDTFVVEEPATQIQSIEVSYGQKNVELDSIKFDFQNTWNNLFRASSQGNVTFCEQVFTVKSAVAATRADVIYTHCYFEKTRIFGGVNAFVKVAASKCFKIGSWNGMVNSADNSRMDCSHGTILDGNNDDDGYGIYAQNSTTVRASTSGAYVRIRNCKVYGIRAIAGSIVNQTANVQYSNNGTNEAARAVEMAWIE